MNSKAFCGRFLLTSAALSILLVSSACSGSPTSPSVAAPKRSLPPAPAFLREVNVRPPAADEDLELVAARYIAANKTSNEVIRCARQWIERVRVMYGAERDQEVQNGPALACQRALDQRRGKPKPASARKA